MSNILSSGHARLSASSAERWMNCAGSARAVAALPNTTSEAAAEGTVAHHIATLCLTEGTVPSDHLGREFEVDGFKITVDGEMAAGVGLYCDTVAELRLEQRWVEMPLAEALAQWDADLGGTADFVTYDPASKLLRVVDFKYGSGVFVSADDNRQLKTYALGVMLSVSGAVNKVEVYIVQPRYEGVEPARMESYDAFDLMEFAGDLATAARATRKPDAPFTAGAWCAKTFCPNARACPALKEKQHQVMAAEFSNIAAYDPVELGRALAAIPLVKERIKALEAFAYSQATAGATIPGFKLVDKVARRQWVDEAAAAAWAMERGVEPYEKSIKSPAQMSSGTTLVPESDSRTAISQMATIEEFAAISGPAKLLT